MEQLEEIIQTLEGGTTSLDDSLKAFEKGIKLSRTCHKELDKAEKKVEVLLKEDGKVTGAKAFEE